MNQPRLNTRTLLIVGLVVVVAILFIIPRLNQGTTVEPTPTIPPAVDNSQPQSGGQGSNSGASTNSDVDLGRIVTSTSVDRDGCPVDPATTFEPVEQVYVVAQDSNIPAGTSVFVRLYLNNQPIEDAPEITADQDYTNSCVNFVFEPESGARFEAGQYEAEFIVNGNAAGSVQFRIQ
jgi:hypothetical protein